MLELRPMAAFVYLPVPPSPLDTWMGNSPEHETAFTPDLVNSVHFKDSYNLSHSLNHLSCSSNESITIILLTGFSLLLFCYSIICDTASYTLLIFWAPLEGLKITPFKMIKIVLTQLKNRS